MNRFIPLFFILLKVLLSFSQDHSLSPTGQKILEANSMLKKNDSLSIAISKEILRENGGNSTYMTKSYLTLSIAYKNLGQYDTSLYYSQKGLDQAIKISDTVNMIKLFSSIGVVHYLRAEYIQANKAFIKMVSLYKKIGFSSETQGLSPLYYAKVLNNIASVYIKSGHSDSALNYFINSIKIREKYNAPPRMIATSKLNLGSIYLALKDHPNSEIWINKALEDASQIPDSNLMAKCYINLGIGAKESGDTTSAIRYYKKSLSICQNLNNQRDKAIVLQNLGALTKDRKDYNEALHYFQMALSINSKIGANNASIHLGLGELYFNKKEYRKSKAHCNTTIRLGKESGNISAQTKAYQLLYLTHKKLKQFNLALAAYEQYSELRDRTHNQENEKYIQNLKAEFETEQKITEINYLKKLNATENIKAKAIQSRQRITIITALLGILLMLVLFVLFIIKRKKDRKLYQIEKKLLETNLHNQELKQKELELEINFRTKQLTTHALNMVQRNQMLSEIREKLKGLTSCVKDELNMDMRNVVKDINRIQRTEKDWELFKKYFEKVNQDFNRKLNEISHELSTHDHRLAALISLNLNIKETATVLNITPNSVKLARHRLRKKLGLSTGDDLYLFLSEL
jgi:tetratricopeptide (TPR) repeat protein